MPKFSSIFFFLLFLFFNSIALGQSGGNGSEGSPYLISTVNDFKWIADVVNTGTLTDTSSFFKQTQDIDFLSENDLTPIGGGSSSLSFSGVYDGNGHSLLNITMNGATDKFGIFGVVNNGIIKNLKVDNANISVQLNSYNGAGILIGALYSNSTIYNVENVTIESSTISSTNSNNGYVGGLIGRTSGSKIINTNVDAEVNAILNNSGNGANIGGFIGRIDNSVFIKHSSSSGTVNTNGWRSGGFLGSGSGSSTTIEECFSTSDVIGGASGQGGFVGNFYQGTIKNCYSIGDISIYPDLITTSDWVGSFFGFGQSSPNYENNYGIGSLPTNGYGFGGYSNVVNGDDNFFDTTTTGTTTALRPFYSGTLNATLNGVTTSEMKTKSTFTDEGWDFINVWDMHSSVNNGYPFLINTVPNPIVKISSAQTSISSTAPVDITFTITESINDFDLSDISLSGNGSIGSVLTQVSSTTYMVAYTAPADQTGTVTITVNDSTFTGGPDGLNNYGDSLVLSYDTTSPEVDTFTSSDINLNSSEEANLAVTLTQSSTTFLQSDIILESSGATTGSLSVFTAVNSKTYSLLYTPPSNFSGTVTLTIPVNSFENTDSPTKSNTQTSTLVLNIDTIAPEISTLSHTHSDLVVRDANTVPFSITFTEPMAVSPKISIGGLVSNEAMTVDRKIILMNENGWISSTGSFNTNGNPKLRNDVLTFSYIEPQYIYKEFNILPNSSTVSSSFQYSRGGHLNDTGKVILKFYNGSNHLSSDDYDSGTLTGNDTNKYHDFELVVPDNANKIRVELHQISEGENWANHYGFKFKNFDISGVENSSYNSLIWTYDWNVPAGNDGIVSATVSATDLFGNYYEGTDSLSFTIDNVSPTITLTENDADDILLVGESTLFTASVNETVSGVPTMTIETLVGTTNDVLTASGADWTYSYTAPSNYSGVVSFTVSLLDVAGNISTATKTLTVDSVTASLTLISSPNANGKYTDDDNNPANSDTISITLTFSEDVVVSSGSYPYLTLNTLPSQNAFYSGGSGTQTLTFSYKVMDGGETTDLGVTNIVLPTGSFIKDVAGNSADLSLGALNASSGNLSDTKDIVIRAKDPTLTTLTAVTNNSTTNFGATDGNTVTYNFFSDIDLLSSSVSMTFDSFASQPTLTQSNSGNTYTLSFTVDANTPEGPLQFNLFATDTHSSTLVPEENRTADYNQSAFNQILIIDRTAPVITSTALTTPENSITGPTVVANEAIFSFSLVGGVDQALFTINPTTGVLSFVNAPDFEAPADSNADNIYDLEVKVTDIVGLTATQTIAVTVTDLSDTFGVDIRATEVQTTEEGGTSVVSVALFTQPTASVTLNFNSSDTTEGIPSLNQMIFTTDNWNIDQTLNMTGQDDQDIDGDVAYSLLVSSVSSSDTNYNSLTGISFGFVNVDNEIDTDGDGFFDYQDAFPIDPLEWLDTDSDGIGNNADLDDDGDGFSDITEITCGSNSLDITDIPLDSDSDGVLDCEDEDDDNDGIIDSIDNCQFTPNINQIDTDSDGKGDVCDSDDDNDGYLDENDAFPLDATEWLDTDADGIGNNADTDDDGDGQLDTDEITCGSDPLLASSISLDTDGDTIPDCVDADDDNDGVLDTEDAFPLDGTEWLDTDKDGTGNNADTDDDNDGFTDLDELACDSDPLDKFSKPADQDQDGLPDCVDADRDGDGVDNTQDIFPDNADEWLDSDEDGLGDNFDLDDDNDGCLDTTDVFPFDSNECSDADNDGIGDNEDPDDNNDGFEDNKLFSSGALTPGSSGLESTWKVINIERYPNARVTIYNKNAQEVFSALGYKNDWRGTYKDSGDLLPAGSYYYIVDPNNGEKALTGWLFITY
jgi:gliding motility-associated-like protein